MSTFANWLFLFFLDKPCEVLFFSLAYDALTTIYFREEDGATMPLLAFTVRILV